jgi:hypothetical protein
MNEHQVEALSNLRPETVVAVEGVPFAVRARALPGVEDALESLSEIAFAGAADMDKIIDVNAALPIKPDTGERIVVTERFIVAGGLCFDDDAEYCNPLTSCDANGYLYHRGRRACRGEESSFFEALGCDGNGDKNFTDENVSSQLAGHVVASIRNNRSLMTTLCNLLRSRGKAATWAAVLKTIEDAIHQEGWKFALDYVAEWFLDVAWWRDLEPVWRDKLDDLERLLSENEAEAAWERAFADGSIGNPLAVLLDIYEHGGVAYSVSGGGMSCYWDTTTGGAVWVPDRVAEENIRWRVLHGLGVGQVRWFGAIGSKDDPLVARYSLDGGKTWVGAYETWRCAMDAMVEASGQDLLVHDLPRLLAGEAERYCRGVLEEYNAWVNGEVYGVVVYIVDRATGERISAHDGEYWGYIGREYAEDALEEAVLNLVASLAAQAH